MSAQGLSRCIQTDKLLGRAWWLRLWTDRSEEHISLDGRVQFYPYFESFYTTVDSDFRSSNSTRSRHEELFYLKVYVAISIATAIIGVARNASSYLLAVRASRVIFEKMLFAVMHAPLRWLDTVPVGRVLNRFTADFNTIDERLAMTWSIFFANLLRLVGVCIASCFASAWLIPPAVTLLILGVVIGDRYLLLSRPLKRLESNAKSPIFELFNTAMTGLTTIRAFQRTDAYLTQLHENLDAWAMTSFYISLANRWMSFRMVLISTAFSIAVGIVIITKSIDPALAGLALSFILDLSDSLRWTIRCYGDMELEMNAMERVVEYMDMETESDAGEKPPAAWPTSGTIEFQNVEVAYAPDLPPVLKEISFTVGHGERVGVVGRTGAGKSSLTLALFRFLNLRSGNIAIDGVNISKVTLHDLRARLSIIPQVVPSVWTFS